MSDILSQSEIDNLLKQLSDGDLDVDQIQGEDEKQVKNYDFSRPTKFSKEHLRTLEIIFEHYSRLVSTNLPVYLRKNVQVSVASSETVTFSEFSNALSNPSVLGIINFAPLNGNIIIEIATVYLYIDEVEVYTPVEEETVWERISTGFVDSLKNIGEGLKEAAIWFVIHIPYLVIWAIVIAVIVLILKKIKKRTKRIRAEEQKKFAEEETKMQKTLQSTEVTENKKEQEK